ncbi:MAG TPA: SDR family NAD(P)-dependent oxidoreductase [Candidatus Binatia bacterium]|jgi:NAD(P)-dependent dehydrogenase (short-subunit alcohol dehydrogenase family)
MSGELDPRAAGAKQIRNKICIITGAGQGIGRTTAKRLGEEGGKIVVVDRIDEGASRTVTELRDCNIEATKVLADVTKFSEAQRLIKKTVETFGAVDFL